MPALYFRIYDMFSTCLHLSDMIKSSIKSNKIFQGSWSTRHFLRSSPFTAHAQSWRHTFPPQNKSFYKATTLAATQYEFPSYSHSITLQSWHVFYLLTCVRHAQILNKKRQNIPRQLIYPPFSKVLPSHCAWADMTTYLPTTKYDIYKATRLAATQYDIPSYSRLITLHLRHVFYSLTCVRQVQNCQWKDKNYKAAYPPAIF